MNSQIESRRGREQEVFKKALIDHVRNFVAAKSEGAETNISALVRESTYRSANTFLAQWVKAKVRGASREEIEIYAASFFSEKPSLDLIAYVYTHRVDLDCVDMDLEKFQDPLLPPGVGDQKNFLRNWLRAKMNKLPEVDAYGRAFFDTLPSFDQVIQAYRLPLDFSVFGRDLDVYQGGLTHLGRTLSTSEESLEGLNANEILGKWNRAIECKAVRYRSLSKDEEQRYARAFFSANPSSALMSFALKHPVNFAGFEENLAKFRDV